jgi:NDP-sugar pyrophosphorylase family protein
MAAGLGSRYGGNKQVDRIGPDGEILMKYSVYDAIKAGFNKIVLIIKPEYKELLEDIFADYIANGIEFCFAYQDFSSIPDIYEIPSERTKPFGTVHALLCAKDIIKEPFAVINADDFYGRDAFVVMHEKLQTLKEKEATMVAYYLKNTVSKNGAVTRGVCELSDGKLTSVTETYKITVAANGDIVDADNGKLDPSALVSMNMWGFMPDIFGDMQTYFENFLKAIPDGEIKAEYALPTMVDSMLGKDLEVYVLSTTATWFGVTYIEDKPEVAAELVKKHESGEYPEILFQ